MINSILDLKGLVMESFHSGEDPDAFEGTIKPWVNTAGFGLTAFLSKYYDNIMEICESPLNMVAVLDRGNKYRIGLFPEYKANRKKAAEKIDPAEKIEVDKAIDLVKQFLLSQGVALVGCKDQEADDVIGYLCKKLEGHKTVHTVDRDLIALSADDVNIFIKGMSVSTMVDKVTVKAEKIELEIPPNLVTLYKSMKGDSSDGYGGVKGFGPAAWVEMVELFGNDGMLELDEMIRLRHKSKIQATADVANCKPLSKCADQYDTWDIMYKVAAIAPEIVKACWIKRVPEQGRLVRCFSQANCEDLLDRYSHDTYKATLVTKDNLQECLEDILTLLEETPFVPWDYETYDAVKVLEFAEAVAGKPYVDMINSKIAGCSFAFGRNVNNVYYFSVEHKDTDNLNKNIVLSVLKMIEQRKIDLVAQNVMFEGTITKVNLDYELHSHQDTRLYAHHIDENSETGLKYLSKTYLNYKQVSYKDTLEAAGAADMSEISGVDVLSYGADDSVVTGHLFSLFTKLTSIEGTRQFIHDYECPAVAELIHAHVTGCNMDSVALKKMSDADDVVIDETMKNMRDLLYENCKEPNFEAVQVLYKDQENYAKVKASKLKKSSPDAIKQALINYKTKLKQACFYEDLVKLKDFKPFIPTPVLFTKVALLLGLPEIEKVSRKYLDAYIEEARETTVKGSEADFFLNIIAPAWNNKGFSKKDTWDYKRLQEFCNDVLKEAAPFKYEGTELNLNSPNQNQYLFYLIMGLPIRIRTKVQRGSVRDEFGLEGSPSTDETAILTAMANDCEGPKETWKKDLLDNLLKHKTAATRKKIYWDVYPSWIAGDPEGKVHPNFKSCGTVTRRPTGSSPNLMQIMKGDVRDMFVAAEGHAICSIDFSSQELRLNADACQDPTWMSAYVGDSPKDLHALTGCKILPTLLHKVGKTNGTLEGLLRVASGMSMPEGSSKGQDMSPLFDDAKTANYEFFKAHQDAKTPLGEYIRKARSAGKTVNFSAQFGAQKQTLSRNLMVPEGEADEYLHAYNATFPMLQVWKNKTIKEARVRGYVETAYGSRRHCGGKDGINSRDRGTASRWERQVCNFIIQGTAADILKVVLTKIRATKILELNQASLIATVYDEVLLHIPEDNLKVVIDGVSEIMSLTVPGGTIPMVPDTSFGPSWGHQVEVGTFPSQEVIDEALSRFSKGEAA